MFSKQQIKIAGRLFWFSAIAALAVSCESEVKIPADPYPPVTPPDQYVWREIPNIPDDLPSTQRSVTHYITVNNQKIRNFTLLYDTEEKLSHWVAYPMSPLYTGDASRSNDFTYDPYFDQNDQMPITSSGYGQYGIDRGHQIASADRYVTQEANNQTFYVTNMTPQNHDLNGGLWSDLENWVRAISKASDRRDTLYVVSGCVIKTAQDPEVDYLTKNGVRGAIPKAYYKVMLRTIDKERAWPVDGNAQCIGVWMANEPLRGNWYDYVKSVAEIEELTGQTFFPAVSSSVKASYSLSDWGLH